MPRIWLGRYSGQVFCCSGRPRTCHNLQLLQAEESEFHDGHLVEATDEINVILDRVKEHAPTDHHLALFDTNEGLVLVWAEVLDPPPPDLTPYVSADSTQEEIRRVLGLTGEGTAAS